ncbi:hypothetical protein B0H11DRAFT_1907374 [Mycena galericulata]|nr:hypothetical protein B0H11DRAFT_1907374 [Mycena galericulata]
MATLLTTDRFLPTDPSYVLQENITRAETSSPATVWKFPPPSTGGHEPQTDRSEQPLTSQFRCSQGLHPEMKDERGKGWDGAESPLGCRGLTCTAVMVHVQQSKGLVGRFAASHPLSFNLFIQIYGALG